jgi:hypothetical protein
MKSQARIEKPEEINVTIETTASIESWTYVRNALKAGLDNRWHRGVFEFIEQIDALVDQVHKEFHYTEKRDNGLLEGDA